LIALLQRVEQAEVRVGGEVVGAIGRGLLVFLGVEKSDVENAEGEKTNAEAKARRLAGRVAHYRCFPSEDGSKPMDKSLLDLGLAVLVVSQFTLCAQTNKGRRPSFDPAAPPDQAKPLYESFKQALMQEGLGQVEGGLFGAMMKVSLVNDGPVTLWLQG